MRKITSLMVLLASVWLVGCGSSSTTLATDAVDPAVTESSADATAYTASLASFQSDNSNADTLEPVALPAAALAFDDSAEPAPVN
ncbi:MAG: hypothetical protein AB9M60_17430 [Leptothrix sp. (in: b-proteobacteria)]